jgi:hypothetical protein
MEHLISQIQPDLIVLKAPKTRDESTAFLPCILPFKNHHVFISRLGAFKIIKSG